MTLIELINKAHDETLEKKPGSAYRLGSDGGITVTHIGADMSRSKQDVVAMYSRRTIVDPRCFPIHSEDGTYGYLIATKEDCFEIREIMLFMESGAVIDLYDQFKGSKGAK